MNKSDLKQISRDSFIRKANNKKSHFFSFSKPEWGLDEWIATKEWPGLEKSFPRPGHIILKLRRRRWRIRLHI